jgi:signal transduction histidine kinase/CheY-like chemotaxis protein
MQAEKSLDHSAEDLDVELVGLKRDLLRISLPIALVVSWLSIPYHMLTRNNVEVNLNPALILIVSTFFIDRLRNRHYTIACWLLLLSLELALLTAMVANPSVTTMAFGVLIVFLANALLGTREALLTLLLTWVACAVVLRGGTSDTRPGLTAIYDTLVLYALVLGVAWLTLRPLRTSIEWALSGWAHARDALTETRNRRGELYRALRALEEATYRIERMNNELIIARHEAEVARALKARFVATVSHELRGPLNLILGFSNLMALSPERYGVSLPSAYRADVVTIYRNSQHLATLVDDILDLSQIEAERLPLVKDRIDLEEDVVKEAVNIVQPLTERKGLYLRQELAGDLPVVLADQVRLRQVLLNLLTNAIRFTEHGGITISTLRRNGDLLVTVRDTGRGIAAEEMPKLFREFHQTHLTETREAGGSGLGLSISKYLVELHGGEIWAESQPGQGTTISFTVPLPGTEPLLPSTVKTGESQHRLNSQESCLIVHDNPGIVRVLARHIDGYRVVGVPNAQEVMTLTEELHPKAIITTPELVASIENQLSPSSFDVPIITCSLPRISNQSHVEGALSYLIKPITPEMVSTVMKQTEREGETTVLLVDDDPDAVRLLEIILTAIPRPYKILKAYDGLKALELMQAVVPDVVFMDLIMPGLDGEQVIARMRADKRLHGVSLVIVSARDWAETASVLGTPISVRCRRPVEVARGAKCLQAMLDALSAHYLPDPAPDCPYRGPVLSAPS